VGRLEEALQDLSQAIRLSPNNANAHYNRGLVHLIKGDRAQAMGRAY
jgi:Flp pilus assembly protein TadD